MSITAIAGLGNPGKEYCGTRHNIGFEVVDAYATHLQAVWEKVRKYDLLWANASQQNKPLHLLKPQTFMNASGSSLRSFCSFHRIPPENVLVIYDDITLEVGRTKLSVSGSSGGHNGVEDVLKCLGAGFLRYRVGIGAKAHPSMDLKDHVLSQFNLNERQLLLSRLSHYVNDITLILESDVAHAMNHINQRSRHHESSSSNE